LIGSKFGFVYCSSQVSWDAFVILTTQVCRVGQRQRGRRGQRRQRGPLVHSAPSGNSRWVMTVGRMRVDRNSSPGETCASGSADRLEWHLSHLDDGNESRIPQIGFVIDIRDRST
jgi:hypothetical protein